MYRVDFVAMAAASVVRFEHVNFDFLGEIFELMSIDDFDEFQPIFEVSFEDRRTLHEQFKTGLNGLLHVQEKQQRGWG